MRFRLSSLLGISLTVIAAFALILMVRSRPGSRENPGLAEPQRGGQLIVSVRSEPRSFNRIVTGTQSTELLSILTQARLVRVNRATHELEPALAVMIGAIAGGYIAAKLAPRAPAEATRRLVVVLGFLMTAWFTWKIL